MKSWLKNHKREIATAITFGAGAAAASYGGPMAGDAAREYTPKILAVLGGLFGL